MPLCTIVLWPELPVMSVNFLPDPLVTQLSKTRKNHLKVRVSGGAEVYYIKYVWSTPDAVKWDPGPCGCYAGFYVSESITL